MQTDLKTLLLGRAFPSRPESRADAQLCALWQQFKGRGCQKAREQLIEAHVYLCGMTARMLIDKMPPSVDIDDLVSDGYVGLIKAVDSFDVGRGVKFSTYAIALIRGAILEALREDDWVPRSVRDKARAVACAEQAFEARQGRAPTEEEVARLMGWTPDVLRRERGLFEQARVQSLSEPVKGLDSETLLVGDVTASESPALWQTMWTGERATLLRQAVSLLPPREATVVLLYYQEQKTHKEIAGRLRVSESRAYQLHHKALGRLRGSLSADREAFV